MPTALDHQTGFEIVFERNPLPMWISDEESLAFLAVNGDLIWNRLRSARAAAT